MNVDTGTVAEAKSKFSKVIDKARTSGLQTFTPNRRTAVVVI